MAATAETANQKGEERGTFHEGSFCRGRLSRPTFIPLYSGSSGVGAGRRRGKRPSSPLICSACHIAAPDQDFEPILRPAAPTFVSIAQRSNVTADFLNTFLTTTHRDISNPKGMPNPLLLDYQIKQISAYILSLRRRS